jgi:putative flippase GtrA
MIPQTFEQWRYCIEKDCGIPLTKAFVTNRLIVFKNPNNNETQKFIALYGQQHLNNIIQWLQQVQ